MMKKKERNHQCFWKMTMQKKAIHRNTIPFAARTTIHRILWSMLYPVFTSEPHRVMSQTPEYLHCIPSHPKF